MSAAQNQSLAERYRPTQLKNILGQPRIVSFIADQLSDKRGRSIILHGPSGCGKSCIAGIYASGLLCRGTGDDEPRPCMRDDCEDCSLIQAERHPNFRILRHGAVNDLQFAEKIAEELPSASLGGGWLVVLIDQAQLMSKRAFDVLHEHISRPLSKVTFILCTEELHAVPARTAELLIPLQVILPNIKTRIAYLEKLCGDAQISAGKGAIELMAELSDGSFTAISRELEIISRIETLDKEGVEKFYLGGRAAYQYVDLVFQQADFETQLKYLDDWEETSVRKIELIGDYLGRLFRMAVRRSVDAPVFGPLNECGPAVDDYFKNAQLLGLRPRAFAHQILRIWSAELKQDSKTVLRKASEFDEIVGQMLAADKSPTKTVAQWLSKRKRTENLRARERASVKPEGSVSVLPNEKEYLKGKDVRKLWDAASFMVQVYGDVLNASISILHKDLPLKTEESPSVLITDMGRELRLMIDGPARRQGRDQPQAHWMYVHRYSEAEGIVTDLVAHIPPQFDIEEWLKRKFLRKRVLGSLSERALIVRQYRTQRHNPSDLNDKKQLERHWSLIRSLCASLDPNEHAKLIDGLKLPKLNRPVGKQMTPHRLRVSRGLDRAARRKANEFLPVISAFDDDAGTSFFTGWEIRNLRYRRDLAEEQAKAKEKLLAWEEGVPADLAKFEKYLARNRTKWTATQPGLS
ncbi:hypothetical protein [Bradyrhizobium sp. sGM-13]|uniref:hypothetical protein n=1 Tax=Bradyrhizobium sp. sGM-13 TaxID=2831781 RepID=UPI001BD02657|nr:hypothetical protein [Bradyrhizobium sp. sGM-13]